MCLDTPLSLLLIRSPGRADAAARGGKQLVPAADAFLGARTAAMSAVSLTEVASANEGFQGRRHAALCGALRQPYSGGSGVGWLHLYTHTPPPP